MSPPRATRSTSAPRQNGLRQAAPEGGDGPDKAQALAAWAMGGAVASSAGPVLGGMLTDPDTFLARVRTSLLIAAGVAALTTVTALLLRTPRVGRTPTDHALAAKEHS